MIEMTSLQPITKSVDSLLTTVSKGKYLAMYVTVKMTVYLTAVSAALFVATP